MTIRTMLALAPIALMTMTGPGFAQQATSAKAPEQPAVPAAQPAKPVPAPLLDEAWLREIVRHLYRWYIDERDIDAVIRAKDVVFWVRELRPKLDEGDRSLFGEVVLPQFKLRVRVKKADYTIPELNVTVKNDGYRITSVARMEDEAAKPAGAAEVTMNYEQLRDALFKTRSLAAFPEGDLLERLRAGVRNQLAKEQPEALAPGPGPAPAPTQVVFMAPLSPVANETWVFWETGRALIRFASDIDLTNPAVWDHEELAVKMFPLDQKVVVSLDEVSGSNAFMTRDEAGRVIFNCVVLGKRIELTPGVAGEKK
jgi:hypothetical protein